MRYLVTTQHQDLKRIFENYLKIITRGINTCVTTTGVNKIDVVPIYDDPDRIQT